MANSYHTLFFKTIICPKKDIVIIIMITQCLVEAKKRKVWESPLFKSYFVLYILVEGWKKVFGAADT